MLSPPLPLHLLNHPFSTDTSSLEFSRSGADLFCRVARTPFCPSLGAVVPKSRPPPLRGIDPGPLNPVGGTVRRAQFRGHDRNRLQDLLGQRLGRQSRVRRRQSRSHAKGKVLRGNGGIHGLRRCQKVQKSRLKTRSCLRWRRSKQVGVKDKMMIDQLSDARVSQFLLELIFPPRRS